MRGPTLLVLLVLWIAARIWELPAFASADFVFVEPPCGVLHREDENNKDKLIAACTKIIAKGGENASAAYLQRGDAYRDKGEIDRAITDYGQAIRLNRRNDDAYTRRCKAYSKKGDHDRAIADCDQVINLDPNRAQNYLFRGQAYVAKGDLDQAIRDLDKAIDLDSGDSKLYQERGRIYEKKSDTTRARVDLDAAGSVEPCRNAASGNTIEACTKVIAASKGPHTAWAYKDRANAHLDKAQLERAIADYEQVLKFDPKQVSAHRGLCQAHLNRKDLDRAVAACSNAIGLDPKNERLQFNRGLAHFYKGNLEQAVLDYGEAIKLNNKYMMAFANRGIAYFGKGQVEDAIADYNRAIELDREFTAAYVNRGLAYEKKGDNHRARTDFNFALSLPPKYDNGKWAQDTARARLVALDAPSAQAPSPSSPAEAASSSTGGRRVALVIGNSVYSAVSKLVNPARDAEAVAVGLRSVGFQSVDLVKDAGRNTMIDALSAFARTADDADWALVYFAGHGIEVEGTNYLIPVDARLATDRDVEAEAVSLGQIRKYIEGGRKLRIVILDACRDNPFVPKMARRERSRNIGRGLGRYEVRDRGWIVVYAAAENQIADDGDYGANSPFATAFVKNLKTPNVEVRRLFDLVRDDVMDMTKDRRTAQEPAIYHSVTAREDFYFLTTQK